MLKDEKRNSHLIFHMVFKEFKKMLNLRFLLYVCIISNNFIQFHPEPICVMYCKHLPKFVKFFQVLFSNLWQSL